MSIITATLQIRRGTAAAWTSANPVLLNGELGYETDSYTTSGGVRNYKFKVGDGSTTWNTLVYAQLGNNGGGGSGSSSSTLSQILLNGATTGGTNIVTSDNDFIESFNGNKYIQLGGSGLATDGLYLGSDNRIVSDAPKHRYPNETASTILSLDANKDLTSLSTSTYPNLTELSHVKGLTSSAQTQINAKENSIAAGTTSQYWRGDKTWQALDTSAVTENTNQYFTNARVDARVAAYTGDVTLSGTVYSIGASKVTNAMLAGSIADNKLASSYMLSDGDLFATTRIAGRWYSGIPYHTLGTTTGFTINSLRAIPYAISFDHTLTGIRVEVTTATAGGKARIGIYSDNGSGYPGSLLLDAGEVDCSTTGMKEVTISQALTKSMKKVWLSVNVNSASNGFRWIGGAAQTYSFLGRDSSGVHGNVYRVTSAYGALPANYPGSATVESVTTQTPLVEVKF